MVKYRKNNDWDMICFLYPTGKVNKNIIEKKLTDYQKTSNLTQDKKDKDIDIVDINISIQDATQDKITIYFAFVDK